MADTINMAKGPTASGDAGGAAMVPTGEAATAIDEVAAATNLTQGYLDPKYGPADEFWCETGVKLRLKKFPGWLGLQAARRLTVPAVPEVFDDDKGRAIRNDMDPVYLEKLASYNLEVGMLQTTINLGFGTELISVPESMETSDGEGWAKALSEIAGIEVEPVGHKSRYVSWLLTTAFTDDTERVRCLTKIITFGSGVTEEAVKSAEAGFPGDVPGQSSNGNGRSNGATVGDNNKADGAGSS